MPVPDLFAEGLARGWTTHDGSRLQQDLTLEADIAIVGSGAGGATSAEILSAAGFKVLLIEEGPLRTSRDFDMQEARAYRSLYQEAIGRTSKDGAITILQGRAVGGTTLVNWTSSFRTPAQTLQHWAHEHGVSGLSAEALQPWFERMEQRLGVAPWAVPPNANNQVLRRGCERLDYHWAVIPRNVRGCWNLGYCGMGCPTNAKQSMLVTSIPALLDKGGELLYFARAERLQVRGEQVVGLDCLGMDERCVAPTGRRIRVIARHYILAGGGINTPGLLLRSEVPDPHQRVGKRTFLHLTNFCAAQFDERIDAFSGAPQSIYSDHFQWRDGAAGPAGYKLEVPPIHPALAATLLGDFGSENAQRMAARRWQPCTRLPHDRLRLGRHPPRLSQHGRDPVRRRRPRGAAAACRCPLREDGPRGTRTDRAPRPGAVPHPPRQRARHGRLRHGRRPAPGGDRQPRPAPSAGQSVHSRRLAVSHQRRRQPAAVDLRPVREAGHAVG